MYLVTRRDLPPGHQATQAAHAAFYFGYEHQPILRFWHEESQYLVLLSVADEAALENLRSRVEAERIPYSSYREPDFGDELTALAIAPGLATQRLCANLPLALKEEAMV